MAAKCQAIARSGSPCGSAPLAGSAWCYIHSPDSAEARRESSRKGGRARSNASRARASLPDPLSPADLQSILGGVLRDVVEGRLEPGVATAAATVCRALVALRQAVELEARLSELEIRAGIGQ